jgi:hypothetical protein
MALPPQTRPTQDPTNFCCSYFSYYCLPSTECILFCLANVFLPTYASLCSWLQPSATTFATATPATATAAPAPSTIAGLLQHRVQHQQLNTDVLLATPATAGTATIRPKRFRYPRYRKPYNFPQPWKQKPPRRKQRKEERQARLATDTATLLKKYSCY